jgi:hypothetical protein
LLSALVRAGASYAMVILSLIDRKAMRPQSPPMKVLIRVPS